MPRRRTTSELRSNAVRSGFVLALLSRGLRFAVSLYLTRALILHYGVDAFGVLALAIGTAALITFWDFAIGELCVYECASANSVQTLQQRLNQACLLSLLPAGAGSLLLVVAGLSYQGELRWLLFGAAAFHLFALYITLASAVLQGLGWTRELNVFAIVALVLDAAAVIGGIAGRLSLVELQWLRFGIQPIAAAVLVALLALLRLPIPRPAWPRRPLLSSMVAFCFKYSIVKGLGNAYLSMTVPLAQRFLSRAALGSYAAAEKWAAPLYRFNGVIWESLFHRVLRLQRPEASADERAAGRVVFEGVSFALALGLGAIAAALVISSHVVFGVWLGTAVARPAVEVFPLLVLAWLLLSVASPASLVVVAEAQRMRLAIAIHCAMVAVNAAMTVGLGARWGLSGVLWALVGANLFTLVLLARYACRIVDARWPAFVARTLFALVPNVAACLAAMWLSKAPARIALLVILLLVAAIWLWRSRLLRRVVQVVRR